jgi:hypothetical protein
MAARLRLYGKLILDLTCASNGGDLGLNGRLFVFALNRPLQGHLAAAHDDLYILTVGRERFVLQDGLADCLSQLAIRGYVTRVVRGFVLGNLVIGISLAIIATAALLGLKVEERSFWRR